MNDKQDKHDNNLNKKDLQNFTYHIFTSINPKVKSIYSLQNPFKKILMRFHPANKLV